MNEFGTGHSAAGPMVGYLYQCRLALLFALEKGFEEQTASICVERIDDVSFNVNGTPLEIIQAKHHLSRSGNLTDSSVDLWRTLKVWIDLFHDNEQLLESSRFILLTTATAPQGSAASHLRYVDRNVSCADELLMRQTNSQTHKSTKKYREAYAALPEYTRLLLLDCAFVVDAYPNIVNVEDDIRKKLALSVRREHLPLLIERLEGWWLRQLVDHLANRTEEIRLAHLESKLTELRESFQLDRLPVDYADEIVPEEQEGSLMSQPFVRQLELIGIGSSRKHYAVRDYYRAFQQRSRWVREQLILDVDLEDYESRLEEAWQPKFAEVEENLSSLSGDRKITEGQKLFKWVEQEADFPLRQVAHRFLSHGSFHILSDRGVIGWHPEYRELLRTNSELQDKGKVSQ